MAGFPYTGSPVSVIHDLARRAGEGLLAAEFLHERNVFVEVVEGNVESVLFRPVAR